MENQAGVKVIPILEMEEFKNLSVPTQEKINVLSKELNIETLSIFNPIVQRMINIEKYKSIKYSDTKGSTSIQDFKDAKADIRNFRAAVRKSKKILKAPYQSIGKQIDAIEKIFVDDATSIENLLLTEFNEYLLAEVVKKEEKEKRKNAVIIQKTVELEEENSEQSLMIKRMNRKIELGDFIFKLNEGLKEKIENYSREALLKEIEKVKETIISYTEDDKVTLLEDQIEDLDEKLTSTIDGMVNHIELKIKEIDSIPIEVEEVSPINEVEPDIEVKEEEKVSPVSEDIGEGTSTVDPDPSELSYDFQDELNIVIGDAIFQAGELVAFSDKQIQVQNSLISGLKNYQDQLNKFLNS